MRTCLAWAAGPLDPTTGWPKTFLLKCTAGGYNVHFELTAHAFERMYRPGGSIGPIIPGSLVVTKVGRTRPLQGRDAQKALRQVAIAFESEIEPAIPRNRSTASLARFSSRGKTIGRSLASGTATAVRGVYETTLGAFLRGMEKGIQDVDKRNSYRVTRRGGRRRRRPNMGSSTRRHMVRRLSSRYNTY